MCEYTKGEFIEGMARLGYFEQFFSKETKIGTSQSQVASLIDIGVRLGRCGSIESLKSKIPELRAELGEERRFREVYSFSFDWARESTIKSLSQDVAVALWLLLFNAHPETSWPTVNKWTEFVQVLIVFQPL